MSPFIRNTMATQTQWANPLTLSAFSLHRNHLDCVQYPRESGQFLIFIASSLLDYSIPLPNPLSTSIIWVLLFSPLFFFPLISHPGFQLISLPCNCFSPPISPKYFGSSLLISPFVSSAFSISLSTHCLSFSSFPFFMLFLDSLHYPH